MSARYWRDTNSKHVIYRTNDDGSVDVRMRSNGWRIKKSKIYKLAINLISDTTMREVNSSEWNKPE
jgi:hypothetical protein